MIYVICVVSTHHCIKNSTNNPNSAIACKSVVGFLSICGGYACSRYLCSERTIEHRVFLDKLEYIPHNYDTTLYAESQIFCFNCLCIVTDTYYLSDNFREKSVHQRVDGEKQQQVTVFLIDYSDVSSREGTKRFTFPEI